MHFESEEVDEYCVSVLDGLVDWVTLSVISVLVGCKINTFWPQHKPVTQSNCPIYIIIMSHTHHTMQLLLPSTQNLTTATSSTVPVIRRMAI